MFNKVLAAGGRSEYTIWIDKWILSYASLRLSQLPSTICNTFEVLMTRLGIIRGFLQPESQKLNAENAITAWKNRKMHGAKHFPLTWRAEGPFGRIRDEASDLEFLIAILLWYSMMCWQQVASQSTQFELIGEFYHTQVLDSGSFLSRFATRLKFSWLDLGFSVTFCNLEVKS